MIFNKRNFLPSVSRSDPSKIIKEISFDQKSELEFFNESKNYPLKFSKTKEGAIIQVLVHNKDLWKKANDYEP